MRGVSNQHDDESMLKADQTELGQCLHKATKMAALESPRLLMYFAKSVQRKLQVLVRVFSSRT